MKRLIFVLGVVALGAAATAPARADFAVAKFKDGWCRVWVDTANKPVDGQLLVWRHHRHWHDSLATWDSGDHHLHQAVAEHRCKG
jgi:hypothetical protein